MIQSSLRVHSARWRSKFLDCFNDIRQWTDPGDGRFLLPKTNTVQHHGTFEQLDSQCRVYPFGTRLRTCPGQMTLIGSMKCIDGFESFLQATVTVVGCVAIGLG